MKIRYSLCIKMVNNSVYELECEDAPINGNEYLEYHYNHVWIKKLEQFVDELNKTNSKYYYIYEPKEENKNDEESSNSRLVEAIQVSNIVNIFIKQQEIIEN